MSPAVSVSVKAGSFVGYAPCVYSTIGRVEPAIYPPKPLTSDPEDIRAYTATLDHADIISETI
jgi:hypothetical protein